MAWIESEIERVSAVKPSIGAEPRPYASKATLPWERPDDGSEVDFHSDREAIFAL